MNNETLWPFEHKDSFGDTLHLEPLDAGPETGLGLEIKRHGYSPEPDAVVFLDLDAIRALHAKLGQHLGMNQ